ncbi:MAG: hypothetical protein HY835_15135 [Anaerolineae bacterium]|nr:hypothetical protein [Anaerolineae bacterium]
MRFLYLFVQTRRENPADVDLPGQQFLVRAGYIQRLGRGVYGLLALGRRVEQRLEARLSASLARLEGAEVYLPGEVDARSAWLEISRSHLRSYKQLPALLFSYSPYLEPSPRRGGGLIASATTRVLELALLSASTDQAAGAEGLVAGELLGELGSLGMPVLGGASAAPGVETGQAWMFPLAAGDDVLLQCEECGYSAEPAAARFRRVQGEPETQQALQEVATPNCKTIAELATFLNVPESRTAKAVFMTAPDGQLVFAVVRGDCELNETALCRVLGVESLRPALDGEIRAVGAEPGYATPVGLKGARVVVDSLAAASPNLVAGANRPGYHLLNVNFGRDYAAEMVAEIAQAHSGDACPECGGALAETRGVVLLRAQRSLPGILAGQSLLYMAESGRTQPVTLTRFTLNLTRLMGCLAERWSDASGLRLPATVAPFGVYLVVLAGKNPAVAEAASGLLAALEAAGISVLLDDRVESPGVKFNDADLIGLPLRLTVSERALQQGGVEARLRGDAESRVLTPDEAVRLVLDLIL